MNPDLTTYLHDHLAGANAAVEVIGLLQKHTEEPVLITFLNSLLIEIEEDKLTFENLLSSLSLCPSSLKQGAAWVSSRVVSLKVKGGKSAFGAFEGLEFLSLGIQGKLSSARHCWKNGILAPALLFTGSIRRHLTANHGNDGVWKAWKAQNRLSTLPTRLGNPCGIRTFSRSRRLRVREKE